MSASRALPYLGLLPYVSGPLSFRGQDWLGAALRALWAAIRGWATVVLRRGNQQDWLFEVMISALSSIPAGLSIPGVSASQARLPAIPPDGAVLLSSVKPDVEDALGVGATVTDHR